MSSIYTCGRMHKSRKHKLFSQSARVRAVTDAVYKIMREELGEEECHRWCSRLNSELGCGTFGPSGRTVSESVAPVPRLWIPPKPKLTLALLDEFERTSNQTSQQAHHIHMGTDRAIFKLLTRGAVDNLRLTRDVNWLQACGELSASQIDDNVKQTQVLYRAAFDLLVYVHARAVELRFEDGSDAFLELHSSDQALVGRSTRGSGVVYCADGRGIFFRAIQAVRGAMLRHMAAVPST